MKERQERWRHQMKGTPTLILPIAAGRNSTRGLELICLPWGTKKKKSYSLKDQLQNKGTSPGTLPNGKISAGIPWVCQAVEHQGLHSPIHLDNEDTCRVQGHSWPATSVSPGPLPHMSLRCPGVLIKSCDVEEQIKYNRPSARTLLNEKRVVLVLRVRAANKYHILCSSSTLIAQV